MILAALRPIPTGRWLLAIGLSTAATAALSRVSMPEVVTQLRDFGAVIEPWTRISIAASPAWLVTCFAASSFGLTLATLSAHRPRLHRAVLSVTLATSIAATGFTFWATLALTCQPIGLTYCCPSGPIK